MIFYLKNHVVFYYITIALKFDDYLICQINIKYRRHRNSLKEKKKKENLATDNTDKHERNCSSSSLLEVFSDCTNSKKDDNRMIVIPVKKNDCHSRENGNLLSYSEK